VENIVQAIARDCLTTAMVRLERREDELGEILMHVHDEVVLDAPLSASVDVVCDVLSEPIEWAPGLILTAAGFETPYYKKD
jgi:DNA polymerase